MKEITPEFIQSQISKGRKYILVIKKTGPVRDQPDEEVNEIQKAHQKHLFTLREQGILLVNGPLLDHPDIQSIGIYNLTDKQEALDIASQDPTVKAGRLVVEAYEWFGLPGSTLV